MGESIMSFVKKYRAFYDMGKRDARKPGSKEILPCVLTENEALAWRMGFRAVKLHQELYRPEFSCPLV